MIREPGWRSFGRTITGAVAGALVALVAGLIAVQLAPENGFADLAAGAVTRIVLIPAGAIVGGLVARSRIR